MNSMVFAQPTVTQAIKSYPKHNPLQLSILALVKTLLHQLEFTKPRYCNCRNKLNSFYALLFVVRCHLISLHKTYLFLLNRLNTNMVRYKKETFLNCQMSIFNILKEINEWKNKLLNLFVCLFVCLFVFFWWREFLKLYLHPLWYIGLMLD